MGAYYIPFVYSSFGKFGFKLFNISQICPRYVVFRWMELSILCKNWKWKWIYVFWSKENKKSLTGYVLTTNRSYQCVNHFRDAIQWKPKSSLGTISSQAEQKPSHLMLTKCNQKRRACSLAITPSYNMIHNWSNEQHQKFAVILYLIFLHQNWYALVSSASYRLGLWILLIGCIDHPCSSLSQSWVCKNCIFFEGLNSSS